MIEIHWTCAVCDEDNFTPEDEPLVCDFCGEDFERDEVETDEVAADDFNPDEAMDIPEEDEEPQ